MKATVSRTELSRAISTVSATAGKISGITISVRSSTLFVYANDYAMSTDVAIMIGGAEPGVVSGINTLSIQAILGSSTAEDVELESNESHLKIKAGYTKASISITPPEEHPSTEPDSTCPFIEVNTKELISALKCAADTCAAGKPTLDAWELNVRIVSKDGKLEIQSTDRRVLALSVVDGINHLGKRGTFDVSIPGESANKISKLDAETTMIFLVGNKLRIECNDTVYTCNTSANKCNEKIGDYVRDALHNGQWRSDIDYKTFKVAVSASEDISDISSTTQVVLDPQSGGRLVTDSTKGHFEFPFNCENNADGLEPYTFRITAGQAKQLLPHLNPSQKIEILRGEPPINPVVVRTDGSLNRIMIMSPIRDTPQDNGTESKTPAG